MKKIYTLILLIAFNFSFSQDARLIGTTWYLKSLILDEVEKASNETLVNNPNLIIQQKDTGYQLEASGDCNNLFGEIEFNEDNTITVYPLSRTNAICIPPDQKIEGDYFGFLNNGSPLIFPNIKFFKYEITENQNDKTLTLLKFNSILTKAVYSNSTLSTTAFKKQDFSFYPNPTSENVKIDFDGNFGNNISVEVYNELGAKFLSQKISTNTSEIETKNLEKGVYLVKIISDNGSSVKKLIKK